MGDAPQRGPASGPAEHRGKRIRARHYADVPGVGAHVSALTVGAVSPAELRRAQYRRAPVSFPATVLASAYSTTTPIKHLVVLFDENVSFDHYFGTYPKAANTDGTPFYAARNTPKNINA